MGTGLILFCRMVGFEFAYRDTFITISVLFMTEEHKDPVKPKLRLSRNSEDPKVEDAPSEANKPTIPPAEETPAPKPEPKPKPKPEPKPEPEPEPKPEPKTEPEQKNEEVLDKAPVNPAQKDPAPTQSPPRLPKPKVSEKANETPGGVVGAKVEKSADYLEEKESSSLLSSILVVFALLAILCGAGYGLYYILKSPADAAATDTVTADNKDTTDTKDVSDVSDASEGSLSGPINKAKDVAAQKADLVASAAPVIEGNDSADLKTSGQTPDPANTGSSKQTVSDFLTNASIGGVRSGEMPKVILNGESYSKGDLIETNTGLRFIGIKEQKLVFRDANGIVYIKSF